MIRPYILTGAPGAGKTAILRQLELEGYSVVEEAATDLIALSQAQGIAEPWTHSAFIDAVADLQRRRLTQSSALPGQVQFHDRSVVCTAALAAYLGHPLSPSVLRDLERIVAEPLCESRSSSSAISASSSPRKRAASASQNPSASSRSTKTPTAASASRS